MIYDAIHRMPEYFSLIPALRIVYSTIIENGFFNIPLGKKVINKDIYLNKEEYFPKSQSSKQFEFHRNYIDVQIVLSGIEMVNVKSYDELANYTTIPYDPEHDISFLKLADADASHIVLNNRLFLLLFPGEIHKPCIRVDNCPVLKVVFKIHV